MDLSIFLGKALGFYLVITSVVAFYQRKSLMKVAKNFVKEDSVMVLSFGSIITIIGLLWVLSHNVWDTTPNIIVSVFAWITLIKGILFMGLPMGWFKGMVKWFSNGIWYTLWPVVGLFIGIYLLNGIYLWF